MKESRLGQAIVMDRVTVISLNHDLDTFQLLQLQRSIETFTLSSLELPCLQRDKKGANLKLVKFFIVEYTIFIGIAKLEYSAERILACRLERLRRKLDPTYSAHGVGRLQTCFLKSYNGAVGWRTALRAK